MTVPAVLPASEAENVQAIHDALSPYFELTSEVWLRHPLTGADHRIDLLAEPRDEFPFPLMGVEVKTSRRHRHFAHLTQALKQCVDYRQCVINDQRLPQHRGLMLPAVALYAGDAEWPDAEWMERLLGKWNVGSFRAERYRGLTLRISAAPIWTQRDGTTGTGAKWPAQRRVGNGRRRAA